MQRVPVDQPRGVVPGPDEEQVLFLGRAIHALFGLETFTAPRDPEMN
jgi:hypothetical protein